jgi:lysophospholipase L1-like esterase
VYRNLAVSSSLISTAAARGNAVDSLFDSARKANILSVMLGTVDLIPGHGGAVSPADAYTQLKSYWRARRAAGFKVVAKTVLPATSIPEAARTEFNSLIRSDNRLYDALADFGADPTMGVSTAPLDKTLYQDGVHPTAYGHSLLSEVERVALLKVLGD